MRDVTAQQLLDLQATEYTDHHRVDVQNADGTWTNYRTAGGFDWLKGYTVGHNVDQPVWDIQVRFHRENRAVHEYSLAPLRSNSPLNVDDSGAYAPALDSGRGIRIYTCTLAAGISEPFASDWVLLIEGEIDGVDSAGEYVVVRARGAISAELADRFVEDLTEYPSDSLEDSMQALIDDWTAGQPALYVPASPGFNTNATKFQGISVLEALMSYAALIGFYVREQWVNSLSAFRLVLEEPNRTVSVADHVFSADDYFDVQQLDIHRTRVRNAIRGTAFESDGDAISYLAEDATSIQRYKRRFYQIAEQQGSPIDTLAELTAMVDAALADLKDPTMDKQVDCRFFWPVQLGDYYTFQANGVHYDSDQDLAVTGFRHEVEVNEGDEENVSQTVLFLTGKPVAFGAYWLKKRRLVAPRPIAQFIPPRIQEDWVRASSSTAQLDLTISDPSLCVSAVRFNKREGSESADAFSGWLTSWDRSTGTIGARAVLTRGEDVSVEAGQESIIRWEVDFVDENGQTQTIAGAVSTSNVDEASTTMYVGFGQFKPVRGSQTDWDIGQGGYLTPTGTTAREYLAFLFLPVGVTITSYALRLYRETTSDAAAGTFNYVPDTGGLTQLGTTRTHSGTGWSTLSESVSRTVAAGEQYAFTVALTNNVGEGNARLVYASVSFTRHDHEENY